MAPLAPQVRSEFAKRLKVIRAQRGFPRARYFASMLGIEENRYTRYERAEVEPSLTLIHKICETLGITPNELLGFEDAPVAARGAAGFAEGSPDGCSAPRAEAHDALAWSLAEEIVKARREHEAGRKAVDPMLDVRDTGALYRGLLAEPFETVARLAEEPAMMAVGSKQKAEIAGLMSRYTSALQGARR